MRRTSETEQSAILEATSGLLRDRGFFETTLEAIAARAGVNPAAIYAHWRSRSELVAAVLRDSANTKTGLPDTGEVRADLVIVLGQLAQVVHASGAMAASVMGAAARDPELAIELRLFVSAWQEPLRNLVRRWIERGVLPETLDEDLAVDLAAAIVWFRRTLIGDRTVPGLPEHLAEPILRAWGYSASR